MDVPNQSTLTGKAAVVTGASSGIGRAIALALAAEGARVTLCARRREVLETIANEARALGGEAQVLTADFQHVNEIDSAIEGAADHWSGLDILINCAGIARQAMLRDGDTQDWRDMLEVNVLGLAVASREALKHFPEAGGHIVNLCSMSGHRVPGRGGFYAATKFAVRAMTEGLRQELRHAGNLTRVSQVSPGFVETPMLDEYFESAGTTRAEAIAYPILRTEEIATVVLGLLKLPENAEITDVLLRPTQQAV